MMIAACVFDLVRVGVDGPQGMKRDVEYYNPHDSSAPNSGIFSTPLVSFLES